MRTIVMAVLAALTIAAPAAADDALGIDRFKTADVGRSDGVMRRHRHVGSIEERVERSELVRTINAKLARWVRPTGKCPLGSSEQLATYYNSGARTATGARFNPMGLTAAHRTLPFGTNLHITNPHNGRSTSIVINDRGPYTNAKIDLAQGAANAIGMRTSIYVCISGIGWASAQ